MDKMREEFSKHCQLWLYSKEVDENDFFVNVTTQRAWDVWVTAWQASRAALVVEFPESKFAPWVSDDIIFGYKAAVSDAKDLLDKAGIKWTE